MLVNTGFVKLFSACQKTFDEYGKQNRFYISVSNK